jgi:hypothetical protein
LILVFQKKISIGICKSGTMRGTTNRQKDVAGMVRRRQKHQAPLAHKQSQYLPALPRKTKRLAATKTNEKP